MTLVRFGVAAGTPLAPDEAYYWVWSRVLQPGYLDDSPMVALWIRVGTLLAGASPLGVRLLGPVAAAAGSFLIYRAAGDFFPERPGTGLTAAGLLNATLLFGVGSVIMTPDTPLLFFWGLGLFALARLAASGDGRWWLLAGLAGGLALDSKYTGLLFLAAVGLWLLASRDARRWLGRPEPWLGLGLAFLVFLPVVVWNGLNHWASFAKQGGRVGAWHPAEAVRFQAELWGGQVGLFTPLVFLLVAAGSWRMAARALREGAPAGILLSLLTLLPAAVFVQHAFGGRVQGNWPAVLYPSAVLAGAWLAGRPWEGLRVPAMALGLAISGFVYLQALAAPFPLPPGLDPSLRELGGWSALATRVGALGREDGAQFLAVHDYGTAAEMAFLGRGPQPVVGAARRWRFFRLPAAAPVIGGRSGLLLLRRGRGSPDARLWGVLAPPIALVRARRGVAAEAYLLYRVRARRGVPGVILPGR
ncbi:MAG: glycosyltransferase family 39 protein [Rhodospirillales bacterium]|nr:glycosyltransferase family 39 protein [Rhodospirillales bacterium]